MSRFLDERGRIFGKVNVVDILVLLVIIAIVAFAVTRVAGGSTPTVPVRVTYTAMKQTFVPQFRTGAVVRDEGGTVLGKVAGPVSVSPTPEEFLTPEGVLKSFDSPVFSDVEVVVVGEGVVSGDNVLIGNVTLLRGEKVVLVGDGNKVQTEITSFVWGPEAVR